MLKQYTKTPNLTTLCSQYLSERRGQQKFYSKGLRISAYKKGRELSLTAGTGRPALRLLQFDPVGALQPNAFEAPSIRRTFNPVPRESHAVVQADRSHVHLERFHSLPDERDS